MGKKKRGHPDVEELLARPWCYYCERDFEDLKLLISHQKAKHFKCDRCGRRLNTAGGLSVHLNQVHKETLTQVENALPNRQGLDVEIFGMEGVPQDMVDQHRNRIIQNFYQAQESKRIATGNPLPGQSLQHSRKKITFETRQELLTRLAEWRQMKKDGTLPATQEQQMTGVQSAPAHVQVPGYVPPGPPPPAGDEIDQLIRSAEAGAGGVKHDDGAADKKKKDKGRLVYDDAEYSPEERMAALPRYAVA